MKKIIDYIIKHYKGLLTIIVGIVAFLIVVCTGINYENNRDVLFRTELINARESLRDSMETAKNNDVRRLSDSIQAVEGSKSSAALAQAERWKNKSESYAKKNLELSKKVDDLLTLYGDSLSPECKEIVGAMKEQVRGLQLELLSRNKQIEKLNESIKADTTGWNACKDSYASALKTINSKVDLLKIKDSTIDELSFQLEKQNTFINKNKGWIGLGTGFLLALLIL